MNRFTFLAVLAATLGLVPLVQAADVLEISTRSKCLHLRTGPGAANSLGCLPKGSHVKALGGQQGSWLQVEYEGSVGWMYDGGGGRRYLTKVDGSASEEEKSREVRAPDSETLTVNTPGDCLNLRQEATAGSRSLNCVSHGADVQLTGREDGDWVEVRHEGATGWMRKSLRGESYLVDERVAPTASSQTEAGLCETGTCPEASASSEAQPAQNNIRDIVEVADHVEAEAPAEAEAEAPVVKPETSEDLFATLEKFPQGCKYHYRKPRFTSSDVEAFCLNMVNGGIPTCAPSNCSTAAWLALLIKLKEKGRQDLEDFGCKPPKGLGKAYQLFAMEYNGLMRLFDEYDLGPTKQISPSALEREAKNDWPAKGDVILFQRRASGLGALNGSAHTAVFSHFERENGKISSVCYWSSNQKTKGYGYQCESLGRMAFLQVGKVQ